ncbi:MAG: hypothetical protein QHD01_31990 [Bradyrhizobium sp.]|uniref:hypothetical protein n=1 Tax=Bradyrhizobium sp. TaxID=376 RepID=UPI0029B695C5|nr:hypothetical protein [Bradyrhizobium sp.]MDX3971192.1 hypothetical protein [Bradyrhizobium sp.]
MTVAELIAELSKADPDAHVVAPFWRGNLGEVAIVTGTQFATRDGLVLTVDEQRSAQSVKVVELRG